MARQTGDYKITGTYDDVTYYMMEGRYYARKKSSLKGARVKKDPRFKRTMQSAQRLARGSQLASKVYRSLPFKEQVYALYKQLKSLAIQALKENRREEEVLRVLQLHLGKDQDRKQPKAIKQTDAPALKDLQQAPILFRVYGKERKLNPKARSEERNRGQRWVARCRKRRCSR